MYAIFETGGKQHQVAVGDTLNVEKIEAQVGDKIVFEHVLLTKSEGQDPVIGRPYVVGTTIETEVLDQGKAKKVDVFTFKHKGYHKQYGHRQPYTCLKVLKIGA